MEKTIWIHWYTWNPDTNDFWPAMKSNLLESNIELITPTFPESRTTDYTQWEKVLDKQDFSEVTKVIWHSLWTRVATEYIVKNNIKLKRLLLVSPTITAKRTDWTDRVELINFFPDYRFWDTYSKFGKLKDLVEEIIVIASLDDTAVPFQESQDFAKMIWAKFIWTNWNWHFNAKEYRILEELIK